MKGSRFPGFHHLSIEERRALVSAARDLPDDVFELLRDGGLTVERADQLIENVVATFAFPLSIATNFVINGEDRLIPMCVEEPSVVAAASHAAKLARAGGGFVCEADESIMIAQIQLDEVPDAGAARVAIMARADTLLAQANARVPELAQYGGGATALRVRDLGEGMMVVHLHADCADAMGANMVNTMAEAIAPTIAGLARGTMGLRILSNLADQRLVRVRVRVPRSAIDEPLARAIVRASRFAERDPYRAATHNKGIMNGVDAVVLASGNDFRAVEAGAHAFAARGERYAPICVWRNEEDALVGSLEMPMALGTVSGFSRVHPGARFALNVAQVRGSRDLAMLCGAAGVASNLAALRALAGEGIQRGHMRLHARSVAVAAGAKEHVDAVAEVIFAEGVITLSRAREVLAELRNKND